MGLEFLGIPILVKAGGPDLMRRQARGTPQYYSTLTYRSGILSSGGGVRKKEYDQSMGHPPTRPSRQTVNPATGQTVPRNDPSAHIPLKPVSKP